MKLKKVLAAIMTAAIIVSSLAGCGKKEEANVNIGVLKGPTGMGAISLMDEANNGVYEKYNFTLTPDVSDIVARLTNGDLDIGALPTNTAVNLYNKTNGDVELIAINCTGVLYILENGNSINSIKDLKGKTLYCNGKGSNPEYVINFLLKQNGLEPGVDVDIQFKDASEITQLMVSGEGQCCMLPVPAITAICIKNKDVHKALNITEEWTKATNDGSQLTMGCLVATKKFITEHPDDVKLFLERYEKSIQTVLNDIDASAELVAKYEITGSAAIAKNAIPDAGIVCITGKDMKPAINGYYQVLFDANPASLGGKMPEDDFYFEK